MESPVEADEKDCRGVGGKVADEADSCCAVCGTGHVIGDDGEGVMVMHREACIPRTARTLARR